MLSCLLSCVRLPRPEPTAVPYMPCRSTESPGECIEAVRGASLAKEFLSPVISVAQPSQPSQQEMQLRSFLQGQQEPLPLLESPAADEVHRNEQERGGGAQQQESQHLQQLQHEAEGARQQAEAQSPGEQQKQEQRKEEEVEGWYTPKQDRTELIPRGEDEGEKAEEMKKEEEEEVANCNAFTLAAPPCPKTPPPSAACGSLNESAFIPLLCSTRIPGSTGRQRSSSLFGLNGSYYDRFGQERSKSLLDMPDSCVEHLSKLEHHAARSILISPAKPMRTDKEVLERRKEDVKPTMTEAAPLQHVPIETPVLNCTPDTVLQEEEEIGVDEKREEEMKEITIPAKTEAATVDCAQEQQQQRKWSELVPMQPGGDAAPNGQKRHSVNSASVTISSSGHVVFSK